MRGQNGVEFDQASSEHGPRHVTHLFALLLAEIANVRLKIQKPIFCHMEVKTVNSDKKTQKV